jgi:hypothetical protein
MEFLQGHAASNAKIILCLCWRTVGFSLACDADHSPIVAWDATKAVINPSSLKAVPMTMWLGIVLSAMAFAGAAIAGSTADYIGLLGCFPPPDPSDIEPVSRDHNDSTQAPSLTSKTDVLTDLHP